MRNLESRRSAIDAYKNRKRAMGIFAVECSATGEVWVGQSRNLDTQQNAIWFALRIGGGRYASMQRAWNENGADAFSFRTLQQLGEDETEFPEARLKALRASWLERLVAQPV
ncbi:MAG: GIY-YIG nuclease family protein [Devosia sp.]